MPQESRLNFILKQIEDYGSQAAFARAINKPPQQITQWLKGEKPIGEKIVRDIETALDLPRGYIDKDQHEKNEILGDDTFKVPVYNVKLSAGNGEEALNPEDIIDFEHISKSFLTRFRVKPESLAVVTVTGDSMLPTLVSTERVVIDKTRIESTDNKVFALTTKNHCWVKRMRITPVGERWESDNQEYRKDDYVLNDGSSTVVILGKVIYSLGRTID